MQWFVSHFVAACLLPPLNLVLLATAGLLIARRRRALGLGLVWAALIALMALATPFVSERLLAALQPWPALDTTRPTDAQAIVVLGGGKYKRAPEYGGADTVGELTLQRLRYGAKLARELRLPLLVTGGNPTGGAPEGHVMRDVLAREWRLPPRWVEDRSMNTWENAQFSAELLRRDSVGRIILVTHAWHLPRAVESFRRAGLDVIPAGTAFEQPGDQSAVGFVPQANALRESAWAFHEFIGRLWYKFKS